MKKYEALYDWPIQEITRLADSDLAENYANQLSEPKQSNFVALTERMRAHGAELAAAKAIRAHYSRWSDLRSCVEEFGSQFASFPMPTTDKLKLSLLFAEKLAQSSPSLDTVEISTNEFELRELTEPVPQLWFCRENSQSMTDSVVIFSCVNHSGVESNIASSIISPDLLFHLIATLNNTGDFPSSQAILIKKASPSVEVPAMNAFARLIILATGEKIHSAHRYTCPPSIINSDEIRPGVSYQQWGEILNVLSEYNSRDEILLKFLTIYHVIENFMFKRPIVELERQMNGGLFSIRDFRRLYNGVEMAEADALKKLFQAVFKMEAQPGISFQQHLIAKWVALVPIMSKIDINNALLTIGLNLSFNDFNTNSALSFLCKLVYIIRNSIVHNKETEFHLTYASLNANPHLCSLIERFLLPSLEEICFALICKPNSTFWYQNKEIQLYK